jgi:hypothetical protein
MLWLSGRCLFTIRCRLHWLHGRRGFQAAQCADDCRG